MPQVVGVDHLVVRVSDMAASRAFYDRLFSFLGFELLGDYGDMVGWTNRRTRYWIRRAEAGARPYRNGDVGFHHYAFELQSRAEVDELQAFLEAMGATIVDPAGEYYEDYYAVFFLDPDGLKLEGMKSGERSAQGPAA